MTKVVCTAGDEGDVSCKNEFGDTAFCSSINGVCVYEQLMTEEASAEEKVKPVSSQFVRPTDRGSMKMTDTTCVAGGEGDLSCHETYGDTAYCSKSNGVCVYKQPTTE